MTGWERRPFVAAAIPYSFEKTWNILTLHSSTECDNIELLEPSVIDDARNIVKPSSISFENNHQRI